MPLIQVTMVEGRTTEQKHALIRELTDGATRALGVPADRVRVAIYEVGGDDWGIGGQPYSAVRGTPATDSPATPSGGRAVT
jgi:4-oxalocrotonate tautomerase